MKPVQLDLLNIGLTLVALGLACSRPYEVFLLAYAFVGPLHYLTEISWLHDRKNFCTRRIDAALLVAPAVLLMFGLGAATRAWHSPFIAAVASEILVFTFVSALIYQAVKSPWKRLLAMPLVLGVTLLYSQAVGDGYANVRYWIGLFLPTLIHVVLFTACFILLGALRNRSWTSLLSLGVFVASGIFCFLNPLAERVRGPGPWAKAQFGSFGTLDSGLVFLVGMHRSESRDPLMPFHNLEELYASPAALKAATFIAFAYLYHYFNWFSKTALIGWHRISGRRAALILGAWLASVGLYAWNYEAGLYWLALLSLAHVTLEFPLNWLSMREIGARAAAILAGGLRQRIFREELPDEG